MAEPIDVREPPPIFRAQAVAHHRRGRAEKTGPTELPSPPLRPLWLLLGALAATLVLGALLVPVTVYLRGEAVAVAGADASTPGEPVVLVVVLPSSGVARPPDGAEVVLGEGASRGRVLHQAGDLSRAALAARFGIPVAAELPEPAAAAVVRPDIATVRPGDRYPAWIAVGTAPLLARLTGQADE